MSKLFLKCLLENASVYEASLDNGHITEQGPAPGAMFDGIELTDPGDGTTLRTKVILASVKQGFWKKPRFGVRCFLQPEDAAGFQTYIAEVKIDLDVKQGSLVVTGYQIFGESANASTISALNRLAIPHLLPAAQTPAAEATPSVLARLGLTWFNLASNLPILLNCTWSSATQDVASGFTFALQIPFDGDEDAPHQQLTPWAISFLATELPPDDVGRPFLTAFQRQRPDGSRFGLCSLELVLPAEVVLGNWSRLVQERYFDALHTIRDGVPLSFLPSLQPASPLGAFDIRFRLVEPNVTPDSFDQKKHPHQTQFAVRDSASQLDARVNIVPVFACPVGDIACLATFDNVTSAGGTALAVGCTIGIPPANDDLAGFSFSFVHTPPLLGAQSPPATHVRMGALELGFPPDAGTHDLKAPGKIQASFRTHREDNGDDVPDKLRLEDLELVLGVTTLAFGGQDDLPGEEFVPENEAFRRGASASSGRRSPALQIPLGDIPYTSTYFLLSAHETCFEHRSQTLDLQLSQQAAGNDAPLDLVVVDTEPFLIARVSVPNYQKWLLDAVTSQIASWTNRGDATGWQFVSGSATFNLVMPPQGLTEAMHKRRGLDDIIPGQPADFRFTPPATFELFTSSFANATRPGAADQIQTQRFAEAPWNLRRVLGYPGQRAPGAPLNSATFELMYGMSASINHRPGLRLAEIGARIGALPPSPSLLPAWKPAPAQAASYQRGADFWNNLAPRIRTRLAVLEPWDADTPSELSLSQKDDNLSFTLRNNADLAYPTQTTDAIPPSIPRGTLKGSFSWPFESDRIYRALWNKPVSGTSVLSGAAFSSLGGWGRYTARYDNGRTGITTSVRMGRVEAITVERIGRIGNFWNRARHVITYERTVAATRQFYLEQEPFAGIPILRKTAEYVELIEKRRDIDPGVDKMGPCRGCEFPGSDHPRIPVDSLWGQDVGTFGYKIPLWRPDAQPADVYTKPLVDLHLETARDDNSTDRGSMLDPEKLCFYTTTDPNLDDNTDRWPKERGADYDHAPLQSFDKQSFPAPADGNVQSFSPTEEPWVEPGFSAFTYHLTPASIATNIVSGVAKSAVGAGIRTIAIMRGLDASGILDRNNPAHTIHIDAAGLGGLVSNILRPVIAQIPAAATVDDLKNKLDDWQKHAVSAATAASNALNNFGAAVPVNADQVCAAIAKRFKQQLLVLEQAIRSEVAGVLAEAQHFIDGVRLLNGQQVPLPAVGSAERAAIVAGWSDIRAALQGQLRFTRAQWLGGIGAATRVLTGLDNTLAALSAAAQTNLQKAKDEIDAGYRQLDAALSPVRTTVDSQLRPLIGKIADDILKAVDGMLAEASAARDDAKAALDAGGDAAQAFTVARKRVQDAIAKLATLRDGVPLLNDLQQALDKLGPLNIETDLDEITARLQDAVDWAAFLANTRIEAVLLDVESTIDSHIAQLGDRVVAIAQKACSAALSNFSVLNLCKDLATSIEGVKKFFDDLKQNIPSPAVLSKQIEDLLHGFEKDARGMLNVALPQLPALDLPVPGPGVAMSLLRGFGDVPKVPQLDFGALNFSAYRFAGFDPLKGLPFVLPQVNLTPVVAAASRFADDLSQLVPIDLRIPSADLAERLIPAALQNFDWRTLVPKIAGFDLSNLFSGLRPPFESTDQVKITHGLDPQSRSGWVEIDMDVPFGSQPAQVFSYCGVTLVLRDSRFTASTRLEAALGRPPSRSFKGAISGDWDLKVGGYPIAVIVASQLTFDDSGHFGFDVRPDRIRLQSALEFLADLLSTFLSGDGFTTSVTAEGLRTTLDLPLPDVQAGAFGMANLRLGFSFALKVMPTFQIGIGLAIAKPERPFTLTIFILGGAGYFTLDLGYEPGTGKLSARLSIGIFASASLAISLGPISGGIYAYFGITVTYTAVTGNSPSLQVAIVLMFIGQVSLLGFISISLVLSLSAQYQTGGKLTGRGHVSYSIKIGPFFSIDVSADVSYTYSNSPGRRIAAADYTDAATEYLEMFYN